MKSFSSFGLAIVAYIFVTTFLFGDPLTPLWFASAGSDRLGVPYWPAGIVLGVGIAFLVFLPPLRAWLSPVVRLPTFVAASLVLSVLIVGLYTDWKRRKAVAAFAAEHVIQHSFFLSIRLSPRDFQFFLHAAALKDCVPYAWSYRKMAFYVLPPNVAVNVLPSEWIALCLIKRDF